MQLAPWAEGPLAGLGAGCWCANAGDGPDDEEQPRRNNPQTRCQHGPNIEHVLAFTRAESTETKSAASSAGPEIFTSRFATVGSSYRRSLRAATADAATFCTTRAPDGIRPETWCSVHICDLHPLQAEFPPDGLEDEPRYLSLGNLSKDDLLALNSTADLEQQQLQQQQRDLRRLTVVLDLDETMVFARASPEVGENYDFSVTVRGAEFAVVKRPGLDEFLTFLCATCDVVVWTTASREIASLILDRVVPPQASVARIFGDMCTGLVDSWTNAKRLDVLGCDLSRTVLVDNEHLNCCKNARNAIRVPDFRGDRGDKCLAQLQCILNHMRACASDVREFLSSWANRQARRC